MADTPTQAATATAGASRTATGSGAADLTPSNTRTSTGLPEFESDTSFDVEAFLAGDAVESTSGTTNPTTDADPNRNASTDGSDEETATAGTETTTETDEEPNDTAATDEAHADEDDAAEVVEDANTGKRLVGKRHFDRMLRQRNEAKQKAAEVAREAERLQAEVSSLKEQLSKTEDKPVTVSGSTELLGGISNLEQLEATEQNARAWRSWARRNPEGGTPPGMEMELTQEQVVDALERAEAILEAAPKRREFLQQFSQTRQQIREQHPEMFRAGTEEHRAHGEWQRKLLQFASATDQDAIIAKLIKLDRMEREEKEGIASYPRVPKGQKASPATAGTAAVAPKAKPAIITTRPVGSVKPSAAQTAETLNDQLAGNKPLDVEALFETAGA